ncbi:unnamed protein product, partial [Prorocentrum cordatum]
PCNLIRQRLKNRCASTRLRLFPSGPRRRDATVLGTSFSLGAWPQLFTLKSFHPPSPPSAYIVGSCCVVCGLYRPVLAEAEEEVDFVAAAADIVFGCYATQEQIMFALRTWFAFNRLPWSAGAMLGEALPREGLMPTPEALRQVMLLLNEFQPVNREEAVFVWEAAVRLGAAQ